MLYQNHHLSMLPIIFWIPVYQHECTLHPVRAGDMVALCYPLGGVQGTKSGTACLVLGHSNDMFNSELGFITCLVNGEIVDVSPSSLRLFDDETW